MIRSHHHQVVQRLCFPVKQLRSVNSAILCYSEVIIVVTCTYAVYCSSVVTCNICQKIEKQAYTRMTSGVNRCSLITVILLWCQDTLGMSAVLPTFWKRHLKLPSSGKNNKTTAKKDHVHKEGWASVAGVSEQIGKRSPSPVPTFRRTMTFS